MLALNWVTHQYCMIYISEPLGMGNTLFPFKIELPREIPGKKYELFANDIVQVIFMCI